MTLSSREAQYLQLARVYRYCNGRLPDDAFMAFIMGSISPRTVSDFKQGVERKKEQSIEVLTALPDAFTLTFPPYVDLPGELPWPALEGVKSCHE